MLSQYWICSQFRSSLKNSVTVSPIEMALGWIFRIIHVERSLDLWGNEAIYIICPRKYEREGKGFKSFSLRLPSVSLFFFLWIFKATELPKLSLFLYDQSHTLKLTLREHKICTFSPRLTVYLFAVLTVQFSKNPISKITSNLQLAQFCCLHSKLFGTETPRITRKIYMLKFQHCFSYKIVK